MAKTRPDSADLEGRGHPASAGSADVTVELPQGGMVPPDSSSDEEGRSIIRAGGDADLLNSRQIDRTVSAATFLTAELQLVAEKNPSQRDSQEYDTTSRLPPAIERSLSETNLNLRNSVLVPPKSPPEAAKLADYRLLRLLGKGGMGHVYAARQGSLDRIVALKVIQPLEGEKRAKAEEAGELERIESQRRIQFISEAVVTGDLDHPNIVPVHDIAVAEDGSLFYSMRRVTGTPWSKVIRERSRDENLEVLLKVADAVGFAHTRGVVHRDIKPSNIMLGEFGVVTVMDWGLAIAQSGFKNSDKVPQAGGLGGSPAYMAPEMVTGPLERITPASDIYLLGATLFEIITGSPPHHGENVKECLQAVTENKIRDLPRGGSLRNELLDIAMQAMATKPENRFLNVSAFQNAIREYRSHSESRALRGRAEQDLRRGESEGNQSHLFRAIFGFEEAVALWDGNSEAAAGLKKAKLASAELAYRQGEYDLGLSQLDESDPQHGVWIERLRGGRRRARMRKSRIRLLDRATKAMLVVILVGGAAALHTITQSVKETEAQRVLAEQAQGEAEYESYVSRIGLVKARLDGNEFDQARHVLDRIKAERPADRLGWEWRWLDERTRQSLAVRRYSTAVRDLAAGRSGVAAVWALDDGSVYSARTAQGRGLSLGRSWPYAGAAAVTVSDDGEQAAWINAAGRLEIRGLDAGQRRTVIRTGLRRASEIRFTPHGELLTVSGETVGLHDASSGELLAELQFPEPVSAIDAATDYEDQNQLILAAAVSDATEHSVILQSLRRESGAWVEISRATFHGHQARVTAIRLSPDGRRAVSGDVSGELLIWSTESASIGGVRQDAAAEAAEGDEREFRRLTDAVMDGVRSVAFSPTGDHVAAGSDDHTVKIWNAETGELLRICRGHSGPVERVAFVAGPEEQHPLVVSASTDRSVRTWSAVERTDESRLRRTDIRDAASGLQLHDDGDVVSVRFNREGTRAVSAGFDGRAILIRFNDRGTAFADTIPLEVQDAANAEPSADANQPNEREPLRDADFSADGRYVLTVSAGVDLWDDEGKHVDRLDVADPGEIETARFFPAPGQVKVATAGSGGEVKLWKWDAAARQVELERVIRLAGPLIKVRRLLFSSDGRQILAVGDRRLIRLLAEDGSESVFDYELPTDDPETPVDFTSAAFSAEADWFAVGGSDGRGWVFPIEGPQAGAGRSIELVGHSDRIEDIRFLQDATEEVRILTASRDKSIRVWDARLGTAESVSESREILVLRGHAQGVTALDVSPDGQAVISGGSDGAVLLWPAAPVQAESEPES